MSNTDDGRIYVKDILRDAEQDQNDGTTQERWYRYERFKERIRLADDVHSADEYETAIRALQELLER